MALKTPVNHRIECADINPSPSGAEEATICFRFKLYTGTVYWDAAWWWQNHFDVRMDTNDIWFRIQNENSGGTGTESLDIADFTDGDDGEWHSVVIIMDKPNWECYIDGTLHDSGSNFRGLRHNVRTTDDIEIGSNAASGSPGF